MPGVLRVNAVSDAGAFTATCLFDGSWYALNAWVDSAGALRTGWAGERLGKGAGIQVNCRNWD